MQRFIVFLIFTVSLLLFAIEEPDRVDLKKEEQKVAVYSLFDEEDDYREILGPRFPILEIDKHRPPRHALIPETERFHIVISWFETEIKKIFYQNEPKLEKERIFWKLLILIKYNEKEGLFDNIRESEDVFCYPQCPVPLVQDFWWDTALFAEKQEVLDEAFELVEKKYGKALTIKLKAFMSHVEELFAKHRKAIKGETDKDIMIDALYAYQYGHENNIYNYKYLVNCIEAFEVLLPMFENQERVQNMLKEMDLCADYEHFAAKTLQDVALMTFFNDQEWSYNKPPLEYVDFVPLAPDYGRAFYEPLKGKSVDELVEIIYDALESKRVVVMYRVPPETLYSQALEKKYREMNYRELAQWVHDEVKRVCD